MNKSHITFVACYTQYRLIKNINMKTIFNELYRIFLMPYLERDKYFEELCDETQKECEKIVLKILLEQKHNE